MTSKHMLIKLSSQTSRMPPRRATASGERKLQGGSGFTNRLARWRKEHPECVIWHERGKRKGKEAEVTDQPSLSDEEDYTSDSIPDSEPTPYQDLDENAGFYSSHSSSLIPGIDPSSTENQFWLEQSMDINQRMSCPELDPFSGANWSSGIPGGSYTHHQLSTEHVEQTEGSNQYNASPFRQANMPTHTANNAAAEGIYTPGYPFRYAPTYIYPPGNPLG